MKLPAALGIAVATLGMSAIAGCGNPSTAVPVGFSSAPTTALSVPCPTASSAVPSSPTTGTVQPTTTGTNDTFPTTLACETGGVPTTTVPPSTVPPTNALPNTAPTTAVAGTTTSTALGSQPACAPSLTLAPDSGPIGTVVTEIARCFLPNTTITFTVPQSGGLGYRTDQSDSLGTATQQFTYSSANGLVGSTTYTLNASLDRNVGVDGKGCPPSSCATATFYER